MDPPEVIQPYTPPGPSVPTPIIILAPPGLFDPPPQPGTKQVASNDSNQGTSNDSDQGVSNDSGQGASNDSDQGISNDSGQGASNDSDLSALTTF